MVELSQQQLRSMTQLQRSQIESSTTPTQTDVSQIPLQTPAEASKPTTLTVSVSPTRNIQITRTEETIAQEMARRKLSGQRVSLSGRTAAVSERYGYLLGQATRGEVRPYTPGAREIRGAELTSLYRSTPQQQLVTIRGEPISLPQSTTPQPGEAGFVGPIRPQFVNLPTIDPRTGKLFGRVIEAPKGFERFKEFAFEKEAPPRQPVISREPGTFFGEIERKFHELSPGGEELPYGLQPTPEARAGEVPSVRYAHLYVAKKFVESPVGEKVIEFIEKDIPGIKKAYPYAPLIAPFVEELPTFAAAAPFFRTGITAKEKEAIAKVATKSRFSGLRTKKSFKELKDIIKKADKVKLKSLIKSQADKILKNPRLSQAEKNLQLQQLKAVVIEAKTGTPIVTESGLIDVNAYNAAISKVDSEEVTFVIELMGRIPELKGASIITGGVAAIGDISRGEGLIKAEEVGKIKFFGDTQIGKMREVTWVTEISPLAVGVLSILGQPTKQISKQKIKQVQKQREKQAITFIQPSAQAQKFRQRVRQRLGQRADTALTPKFAQASELGMPERFKQPTKLKGGLPFILPKKKKPKKLKKKKGIPFGLITPFVKRYQQWIPVGDPTTAKKAFEVGIARVKGRLAASLQLRRPSGEVIPIPVPSDVFRRAKRDPFTIVQKRGERLAARGEVQEIIRTRRGVNFFK